MLCYGTMCLKHLVLCYDTVLYSEVILKSYYVYVMMYL